MKTKVKEISHKGSSSVIEWVDLAGNLKRSILPSTELIHESGQLFVEDPEDGALYGEDWEKLISTKMGPKAIADLLRKQGIWTLEDYFSQTAIVTGVFNEACSANQQQFREAVRMRIQGRK